MGATTRQDDTKSGVTSGQPRAYIVTIYGLYAREVGGWLSVSALIRLMARLGVDEPAVRASISRLKRRGILVPERVDGAAGYSLSAQARSILDEGDRRIFHRERASIDDGWVVVVFSVPESERQQRHRLRSRLTWLGFGTVSSAVWIAPAHLEQETRDLLVRDGLLDYVDLFHSQYLGFKDLHHQTSQWWDLEALDVLYSQFHDAFAPVLSSWRTRRRRDDEGEAFAEYVSALTMWRRLPYLDPGLAPELLPRPWSGFQAAETFSALKYRLEAPSHRFVDSIRTV